MKVSVVTSPVAELSGSAGPLTVVRLFRIGLLFCELFFAAVRRIGLMGFESFAMIAVSGFSERWDHRGAMARYGRLPTAVPHGS